MKAVELLLASHEKDVATPLALDSAKYLSDPRQVSALGAVIDLKEGYIEVTSPKGLTGAPIVFPSVSVGATENLLMAATLARGETVISNAARGSRRRLAVLARPSVIET